MDSGHPAETDAIPRIRCEGVTKTYPGVIASDNIALSIQPGEIHALLGENGAGKSTLMKILYGVTQPDKGQIWWDGKPVRLNSPAQARQLGIGMVFQHFSLFETLTVAQNIALSLGKKSTGNLKALAIRITETAEAYGMPVDPDRHVHTLSTGERQRVEIIRCLIQNVRLLILDEPTSVLTPSEVDKLFIVLRQLSQEGCSILFISHKLHEVQALCHTATILRHGRITGQCNPKTTAPQAMARMMVGNNARLHTRYPSQTGKNAALIIDQLSEPADHSFGTALKGVHFSALRGEILGIAGVAGNGQKELLSLLSGERRASVKQSLQMDDQSIGHWSPRRRRANGICVVPEERLGRGAVPDMHLRDNTLLTGFLQDTVTGGFVRNRRVTAFADRIIEHFGVKTSTSKAAAKSLSGGNLQKFIIGREILQRPEVLVCAHPTWGVDVGAANTIHEALIALRDAGAAIIVISEDLDELFQISDRIGALCNGQLSPIKPTADVSLDEVGSWMAGLFTVDDITATPANPTQASPEETYAPEH
ncbi:MAG: ABC transporter [Oceanospirillales bacterium LUC14_002_19_P2]|nr:MAG: ABC transporter [Oceanospirillales bacterium LUC14_002_19_P2]